MKPIETEVPRRPQPARRPYAPPAILDIELAAEESLVSSCKAGGVCDIPQPPLLDPSFGPGS